jgi:hypothetical protein
MICRGSVELATVGAPFVDYESAFVVTTSVFMGYPVEDGSAANINFQPAGFAGEAA